MKGNFRLKVSILLLFFAFCCTKPTWGQSKCNSEILLKEINTATSGQDNGSIALEVKSDGGFECRLYRMTSTKDELVGTIKGSGDQLVTFENLAPYGLYSVVTTFYAEEDFKCKERQITDLSTIE